MERKDTDRPVNMGPGLSKDPAMLQLTAESKLEIRLL